MLARCTLFSSVRNPGNPFQGSSSIIYDTVRYGTPTCITGNPPCAFSICTLLVIMPLLLEYTNSEAAATWYLYLQLELRQILDLPRTIEIFRNI